LSKQELDGNLRQKLLDIAKSTGTDPEAVITAFDNLKKKLPGKPEKVVLNAVMSHLRVRSVSSGRKSKLGNFLGFMIGDMGMRDIAEEMRNRVEREIRRYGFDYVKEQGMVDDEGNVLDFREKVFGQPNPNKGEVLPENKHIRSHNLWMIAKTADSDKFELAFMQTNNNALALAWNQLPPFQWVTFPALIQSHDSTGYKLSGSTAKATKTVFKAVKCDRSVYEVFEEVMGPHVTPINKIEDHYEATKDAWDRWVVTYGIISNLNTDRETFFGVPGLLIDADEGYEPENQIRFYVPMHVPVNCGVFSEVYLFGRPRRAKYRDQESGELVDGDVVVDAFGILPNPLFMVGKDEAVLEDEEEEEIDGFIPLE